MAGNSLSLLPRPPFALLARVKSLFASLSNACYHVLRVWKQSLSRLKDLHR